MGTKIGNEHNMVSVQAKVVVGNGYAITADGYIWTGSSPANKTPIGISCVNESVAIGEGISVNTIRTRVIMKSGGTFTRGQDLYLDSTGRAVYDATPSDGDWHVGVSDDVATAAGQDCYVYQDIYKVVIDT